jgi:hypothetical protein
MKTLHLCAAVVCVAATACAPATYSRTDVSPVSTGDQLPGSISLDHATVPVAGVVVAHIAPFNSDDNPMVGNVVSDDPSTMQVLPAIGDKNYALLGVNTGSTTLRLLADGVVVASVPADVTPQP